MRFLNKLFKPNIKKLKDEGDATELIRCLENKDKNIRLEAIKALGIIKYPNSVDHLIALLQEDDKDVRNLAIVSLIKVENSARVVEAIAPLLNHGDTKDEAMRALVEAKDPRAVKPLVDSLPSLPDIPAFNPIDDFICKIEENSRLLNLVSSLVKIGKPAIPELLIALKNSFPYRKRFIICALGGIRDYRAVDALIEELRNSNSNQNREVASDALKSITGKNFGTDLKKWRNWWQQVRGKYLAS